MCTVLRAEHETAVDRAPKSIQEEKMESAVPLSEVLMASQSHENFSGPWLPPLRQMSSLSGPNDAYIPRTVLRDFVW